MAQRLGQVVSQKRGVLLLEPVVELLGALLHVKGGADPARHIDKGDGFLLVQRNGETLQLLAWVLRS